MVNNDHKKLPVFVCFGDGTLIPDEYIHEIRACTIKHSYISPWHAGDIIILDNLQIGHGRMPNEGDRKILVTMRN